jgi:hypothetical protein
MIDDGGKEDIRGLLLIAKFKSTKKDPVPQSFLVC